MSPEPRPPTRFGGYCGPLEQVDACLSYYAEYREEMDAWIERAQAIAEREWHRKQAIAELLTEHPDDATLRNRIHHLP